MKALFCALILSFSFSTLAVADQPTLPALKAIEIAQADLDSRGLQGKVYIYQLTHKKGGIMGGKEHWEILWSDDFPAQTEGRKEFGLRITMDGNYKRAVK